MRSLLPAKLTGLSQTAPPEDASASLRDFSKGQCWAGCFSQRYPAERCLVGLLHWGQVYAGCPPLLCPGRHHTTRSQREELKRVPGFGSPLQGTICTFLRGLGQGSVPPFAHLLCSENGRKSLRLQRGHCGAWRPRDCVSGIVSLAPVSSRDERPWGRQTLPSGEGCACETARYF